VLSDEAIDARIELALGAISTAPAAAQAKKKKRKDK
jgi:hypothetical protein